MTASGPSAKAHTTAKQRPANETSVNRKLRDALSPSRSPSPSLSPRSPRRHGFDGIDEGPGSGYGRRRLSNESWGNGHRRGDSRYQYSDRRLAYAEVPRKRSHFRDDDYQHDSSRLLSYDERSGHRHKRRRSRSRSPVTRHKHRSGYPQDRRGSNDSAATSNGSTHSKEPSGLTHRNKQPLGHSVRPDQFSLRRHATEINATQVQDHGLSEKSMRNQSVACSKGILHYANEIPISASGEVAEKLKVSFAIGVKDDESTKDTAQEQEAISIEERRRRREAIKAKHKSSATPLMVQVLDQSTTPQEATPTAGSERSGTIVDPYKAAFIDTDLLVSPSLSTPGTPQSHGSPASPHTPGSPEEEDFIGLSKQVDTDDATNIEGPSAADYDPTNDMNEDRLRHQCHQDETNAEDYDETKANDRDITVTAPETHQKSMKAAAADDMFASDDDDNDMFANGNEKPVNDKGKSEPPISAASTKQPKQLHQSMLDNWDDDEGYYRIIIGELIDDRYHVQSNLGKGVFSGVVRAYDNLNKKQVAIKIIRNNETMTKAGATEIGVLEKLNEADLEDKKHMIRLERHFSHKNHLCMVFEHLNFNLREVLKKFGREVGLNSQAIRSYAQQMFLGLSLMRKCGILHADLKPDNMLVSGANNKHLKICDLGSAENAMDTHPKTDNTYLVSRFYRAPQIIHGIPYDYAIDMWSVGCTLYELWTGKILFNGRDNNQMLRCMMECRGKFSLKMLKKAEHAIDHFENDNDLSFCSREVDRITKKVVTRKMNFSKPVQDLKSKLSAAAPRNMGTAEVRELNLFVDLLDRCLALNPERRIAPAEALKHPFFKTVQGPAGVK